jgi:hypothetical protein
MEVFCFSLMTPLPAVVLYRPDYSTAAGLHETG